jgi:hypothetical protein
MLVFDKNLICNNLEIDGLSQHSLHYFPLGQPSPFPTPSSYYIDQNAGNWNRYYTMYREGPDGILERRFYSRFLGINSSLLRIEFLSGFLPLLFRSTKCYS